MLIILLLVFTPLWLPVVVALAYRLLIKNHVPKTTQKRIRQVAWGLCLVVWMLWLVGILMDK